MFDAVATFLLFDRSFRHGQSHHFAHWYPTAAYLYILWLDALALAWEYLRRHPDYRLDWLRRRASHRTRRIAGACACWKTQPGCARRASGLAARPWPWCSSIPMPTRRPMRPPSRSGAFPATSN
jgi:hypothetical protein